MLGPRKSALSVSENITKNRVEKIKKVDIDIFKEGTIPVSLKTFLLQELTLNTPMRNLFIDKDTGYMRFMIKADGVTKVVSNLVLDTDMKLNPQLVQGKEDSHYEVGLRLEDLSGTHICMLRLQRCSLDEEGNLVLLKEFEDYMYRFKIVVREKDALSIIDVPVDTYRDALLNVTKLWLLSRKYDRVRNPGWAGFFDNQLREYEMSEKGAKQVEEDLLKQISGKISDVYISDIKATPHLESRSWDVSVVSTDTETQISTTNMKEKELMRTISIDDDKVSKVDVVD